MEPLIKHGELVSWPPELAAERYLWEVQAAGILKDHGFLEVRTPHIYKKELRDQFSAASCLFGRGMYFLETEKRPEFKEYVGLACKNLLHIPIFRVRPHSYKELPIRYFEIGEAYECNFTPINRLGVFVTSFCEAKDKDKEVDLRRNALRLIVSISKFIKFRSGKYYETAESKTDLYTTEDDLKKPVTILMATNCFEGVADEN